MTAIGSKIPKVILSATRSMLAKKKLDLLKDESLQKKVFNSIPQFASHLHKGKMGCICVIGGSREYTGAPYYAAMASLRLGADLAHIFCSESSGTAIKCYSPDIIVHPILNDSDVLEQLKQWLPRFHAVVIGPGLGRSEYAIDTTKDILKLLKDSKKPIIIDADGLFVITQDTALLKDFDNVILTPNVVEYGRLVNALNASQTETDSYVEDLNHFLPNLTVVEKGKIDRIYTSEFSIHVSNESIKRCGGQGDILSGAIALFAHWFSNVCDGQITKDFTATPHSNILACYSACSFTRHLNKVTFTELGRGMQASDMLNVKYTQKAFQLFLNQVSKGDS